MASPGLNETNHYADFFWQQVGARVAYWRDYVTAQATNGPALTGKQGQIMRAIHFGLRETAAWSTILALIEAFAPYMERAGQWEAWQVILERGLTVAQRLDDLAGVVKLSVLQARLLQRQSRFKEAIAVYRRAIRLARRVGDEFSEARACSNLGFLYAQLGSWERSEVLCCHALTVFRKLNSNHGLAYTENHLGSLYIWQCRWGLAKKHLERACEIWKSMGDNQGLVDGYMNLGLLYNDIKQPEKALIYHRKALYQAELIGEETKVANIYVNLGITYRLNHQVSEAELYARRAEAIFRRTQDLLGTAQVEDNLGLVYLDQSRWVDSKRHLKNALEIWRQLANDYGEIRTLTYLVEHEHAKGELTKVAKQVAQIEQFIQQLGQGGQAPHWQTLLRKCRCILAEGVSSGMQRLKPN